MHTIKQLYKDPVGIFLARTTSSELPPDWESWYLRKSVEWEKAGRAPRGVFCRCVRLKRLEDVLKDGIDVKGGPVWGSPFLEKAWEYGGQKGESRGLEKLVLFLSQESLELSCRIVPKDTPKDELERWKTKYPTQFPLEDESGIWLSRLNTGQAGTDAETHFCRFPIGDPYRGLIALMIVLEPSADAKPTEVILADRFGPAPPA